MKIIWVALLGVSVFSVAVATPRFVDRQPIHVQQDEHAGFTPLMLAVERGQISVVRSLLKQGADVNAKHPAGFTALMLAAQKGNLAIVKDLLSAGANPNVRVQIPMPAKSHC